MQMSTQTQNPALAIVSILTQLLH